MKSNEKYALYDELAQFLGSYFHQDMGSCSRALDEFLSHETMAYKMEILNLSEDFLASSLSEEEKTAFIEKHCEIYFKGMGTTALDWYKDVIKSIKASIQF